ncbi:MAG: transaldolase family protein [Clostridia bacterium]|nr:transaldolase family protein [Clostridia bacterium]MDR3644213.1 transaldolase family protein [Clostridia bacterium]
MSNDYLKWLSGSTVSNWWHDSADLITMDEAIANGATGVTTNPLLVKRSLYGFPDFWRPLLSDIPASWTGAQKAEEIIRHITVEIAKKFEPIYHATKGEQGYVCAQVNPVFAGDCDIMLTMARRLHDWAPNIAVKLPVTAAGLDALEECISEGITVTATASFTVPQALSAGKRHMAGLARAKQKGIEGGRCFAVIMVGRLDDYLRDVAHDQRSAVPESDIIQAGTAAIKRAYRIFGEEGYHAVLMPAGMRGAYHTTALAGAPMSMSIAPNIQKMLRETPQPWSEHIEEDVPKDVIDRLMTLSEFVRAYEPEGMKPTDFITYGASQKTLSQFVEAGWHPIEEFKI